MTDSCEWMALDRRSLGIAFLAACAGICIGLGGSSAGQACEPALLPASGQMGAASGAAPAGPLLKASEANTPARLDDEAASESEPISRRPLQCCRPSGSAASNARVRPQVHPTLAALAEAVLPRIPTKQAAPQFKAPQSLMPVAPDSFAEPNIPARENTEPRPLRDDSFDAPAPIAPAEPQPPSAEAAPLTIANPWAKRTAPAKRSSPAKPLAQQSAESREVRLARFHRSESQAMASVSAAPLAERTPPSQAVVEVSAGANPLRGGDAGHVARGGWSSATANPLR